MTAALRKLIITVTIIRFSKLNLNEEDVVDQNRYRGELRRYRKFLDIAVPRNIATLLQRRYTQSTESDGTIAADEEFITHLNETAAKIFGKNTHWKFLRSPDNERENII